MYQRFSHLLVASVATVFLFTSLAGSNPAFGDNNEPSPDAQPQVSAKEALALLKEGNLRFVEGRPKHPHEDLRWRQLLREGQKPFATILGCSDSRVIPELIFDEGLGDLFVIRVGGNIVDRDVKGSVEYAVEHLDTHLIVVLGHEKCGAVTAAISKHDDEPKELMALIDRLQESIFEHHEGEPDVDRTSEVATAVRKNVMSAVRQLKACRDLRLGMKAHHVKIIGAIYDLKTGKVLWLE